MRPKSACAFIAASYWDFRSADVKGARGSSATTSGVSITRSPFVRRTVYVPGRTRGPVEAPAVDAAVGTRGGFSCMDHSTRLMPLRLPAGGVSTTRPEASRISSFIRPNVCRVLWVYVMTAADGGLGPAYEA